ncbi:MAG: hypothetical protein KGH93_02360 [Patescibacteria group bacterium]|nr:hypothetical protein [Patescibacteria group bacterium]MDE1946020.1 hypothetical protein [Patescibacteria group bacterium]
MKRFLTDCLLFLSLFFLPPLAAFILAVSAVFFFDLFFEAIVFAALLDILYSGGGFLGIRSGHVFLFGAIVIFLASFPVKSSVLWYHRQ